MTPINEEIAAPVVCVDSRRDGARLGTMPIERALEIARGRGLGLIMRSPAALPPLCDIPA